MDSISMSKVIALILAFSPAFLMVNIGESFNIKLLLISLILLFNTSLGWKNLPSASSKYLKLSTDYPSNSYSNFSLGFLVFTAVILNFIFILSPKIFLINILYFKVFKKRR